MDTRSKGRRNLFAATGVTAAVATSGVLALTLSGEHTASATSSTTTTVATTSASPSATATGSSTSSSGSSSGSTSQVTSTDQTAVTTSTGS